MRNLRHFAIWTLLLAGRDSPEPRDRMAGTQHDGASDAVAERNRQIEKSNAKRPGDMGITPIAQRVSRVEYDSDRDTDHAHHGNGTSFLVVTRQPDGRFKGTLAVKFHELPKPERHAWGEVTAEFTLSGEVFQQGLK
jgi:hypothetical protein